MKNLIIALSLAGLSFSSANAQTTTTTCAAPKDKVCKRNGNGTSCYATKYAEDFKVCKGDYGYFICCEEPKYSNSTHPRINMAGMAKNNDGMSDDEFVAMNSNGNKYQKQTATENDMQNMTAPQSQSYPDYAMNTATAYEGYYNTGKHYIKVCYGGDNVAELNAAAYHGCPAPAYDGPDANKGRNLNANNMIDNIAPITGQSK